VTDLSKGPSLTMRDITKEPSHTVTDISNDAKFISSFRLVTSNRTCIVFHSLIPQELREQLLCITQYHHHHAHSSNFSIILTERFQNQYRCKICHPMHSNAFNVNHVICLRKGKSLLHSVLQENVKNVFPTYFLMKIRFYRFHYGPSLMNTSTHS